MTKIEGAKLVAEMRLKGMNNIQIGLAVDRNRNWVSSRVTMARELGMLRLKSLVSIHDQITLSLEAKDSKRGSVKQALSALDESELWWLLDQLPAGMSVAELIAAIVKDAYAEEMGE
jgi:hypothetical protein